MIFVTGGTGLVGSHLLYQLTSAGKRVKALKRKSSNTKQVIKTFSFYSDNPEKLFDLIDWVEGDILDYYSLESLLEGITAIYHCAALISFQSDDRTKMISGNVEGTANLVNAALEKGVRQICHVSSISALGKLPGGKSVDENTTWVPSKKVTGYSESKFFSEAEIWRGIEEGLDAVIVNPSIILGPGQWENGSSRLFKSVWDGLKFYTNGITGYVDVRDVVSSMIKLMEPEIFSKAKNQRYILNAENISFRELFSQIAMALGKPEPKYKATGIMLGFAWRASSLLAKILGTPSPLTRETASSSVEINRFDGGKISRLIDFSYIPVKTSIQHTARCFMTDHKNP